jgi:hypothetical protein
MTGPEALAMLDAILAAADGPQTLACVDRLRARMDQETEHAIQFWSSRPDEDGLAAVRSVLVAETIKEVPQESRPAALELMRIGAMLVMTALPQREIEE